MLARASFQNFKALKAVEVDLAPFTVLVGKNGSGKTSVLQAIFDLSRVAVPQPGEDHPQQRLALIFSGAHAPDRLVTRPGQGPVTIALTDTDGSTLCLEARVAPAAGEQGPVRFTIQADPPPITLPIVTAEDGQRVQSFLASPSVQRFGSAVFLRLDPSVMVIDSVPSSEEPRLAHDGAGLASVLAYLAGAEPAVLEAIRADLAKLVPEVRGIRTFPARITTQRREVVTVGAQSMVTTLPEQVMGHRFALDMGAGRLVYADMLSEGTVLALGLLTVLHDPACPRLVLLDDIDAALHSTAQAELVRCLRALQTARPDVQIVCTSHSPYLLDHVAVSEVRVMALDKDGHAQCRRLGDHPESEKWRNLVRTGEFWASVGEDWIVEAGADAR